ncbi:MAG: ATP-binding protein, partial [Planctomycetota bacterium]|nr:ATP-binding protein [Planctomycetota bacterium]
DQLNNTSQYLENVIECMGDALVVTDGMGVITKVNDPLLRMLDYSEDELLAQNSEMLFAGPSPFTQSSQKILYREFTKNCDTSFRARGGDEIPVSLTISLLMHKNGSQEDHFGIIYVAQDMTERKRYEKQLIDAKLLAEDGARTKAEFLATMSHEIRTPMHGVIGMTDLLLDTDLNSTQRKFIEVIRVSGNSLLALLNDILDFSKIESDKLELEIQPLELRPLVEQAVELFSIKAAEKNLELAYYIAPSIPQFVRGDPIRIRQALVNLIGNAIKFTDSGEISIRVTPLSEAKNKIELQFSVEDTGIGIEKDRLASIFENFEQADNSISRRYGGTGLGLTISQKLVRLMGGKIWVESKVGLGSTFHFTISTTRSLAPAEAPFRALLPKLKGKRLLILERNATSRKDLHHQCLTWGCEVYTCEYLSAAKDWLKQDIPFHAVLLDENCLGDGAGEEGEQAYTVDELKMSCDAMNCEIINLRSISSQASESFNGRNELVKPVKKKELYNALMQVIHGCERSIMNSGSAEISPFEATLGKSFPARILVVEDNPINQQLAIHNFEKLGYRIELASNGQKALAALEVKVFDIVFMDLRMPDMGGIEATQHIISNFSATKRPRIIAMTADAQASVHKECVEAGMDDFLTKPVKIRDLIRALRKWGPSPNSLEKQSSRLSSKELKSPSRVIDPKSIENLKMASRDPRFVGRLIGMFLSQAPKFLQQIETGLANNDFHMIRAAAHNLKGDSSNFGAKALGEVASKIQDLDPSKINLLREHIPQLKEAYKIVEQELKKVAKEEQRKSGVKSKPSHD